jgi:molybdopterin adenylyltransferase
MKTETLKVGIMTVSDRAFRGEYEDRGGPAIREWLERVIVSVWAAVTRIVPDEQAEIEAGLIEMVDREHCHLVLTTGGTGPARRDVTPEATLAVADKVMDGFGERMRAISLKYVPTAILSRQMGVIRGGALIVNLPGQPKAIKETLDELFEAIPYCIELIEGPIIETDEQWVKAFRPSSAGVKGKTP